MVKTRIVRGLHMNESIPKSSLSSSLGIFFCCLWSVFTSAEPCRAEADTTEFAPIGLMISTKIDTTVSHSTSLETLLDSTEQRDITGMISDKCKTTIDSMLAVHNLDIPIVGDSSELRLHDQITKWCYLISTLTIDSRGIYNLSSELVFTDHLQPLHSFKHSLMDHSSAWIESDLDSLTRDLSGSVSSIISKWLAESRYKVRVMVGEFSDSRVESDRSFLSQGLRSMVEADLAQNDAFLVYSTRDSSLTGSIAKRYANYEIEGSFFAYESSVRIDIHCLRIPSGRILLSRSIVLDTLTLGQLSARVVVAMNRLKTAMLADLAQVNTSLAIVAEPPSRYFQSTGSVDEVNDIARLFRRNVINNMKRLIHLDGWRQGQRSLDVHDDGEILDQYLEEYHAPGEIISNLAVDYLVLVKLDDLGQRLRVAATLYSYSSDPPIIADYVFTGDNSKAKFRDLIDETLFRIAARLCDEGLYDDSTICSDEYEKAEAAGATEDAKAAKKDAISVIQRNTKDVRVIDIRSNKAYGARLGGIEHRDDDLYLNRRSGEYLEMFYSYRLPHRSWMPSWTAAEIEASLGMDYGAGNLFRRGLTSLNLLLELRFVVTSLQYTDLPITIAVGGGLGIGGISLKYKEGHAPYTGTGEYEDAVFRPVLAGSARLEFPVLRWLRFQVLMRKIYQTGGVISRFEDFPYDGSIVEPVRGKLGGWQTLAGFKIVFR